MITFREINQLRPKRALYSLLFQICRELTMRLPLLLVVMSLSVFLAEAAAAASPAPHLPAAIFTDPEADKAHPARMTVLHIPSHGALINGIVYQPPGAAAHPTMVLCHGLPGNEKNLDLAQAVRRAGWNVVTFNYRGSWGSPGNFRFAQNLEDADSVLAYLRDPANAAALGIDPHRLVIAGHSMGAWVAAHTAGHDSGLMGVVLISMGDMSRLAAMPRDRLVPSMADNMESLAGVTAESMADEIVSHAKEFGLQDSAAGLSNMPLLALTSDDGLADHTDALVRAIKAAGGNKVTTRHGATDHGWSDHRIVLESDVIRWIQRLL
jgi:pimeloyl-ACP methyl ester carboxylesterase